MFQKWKDIAREYKRTEEYSERKRAVRHAKTRPLTSSGPRKKGNAEVNDDEFDSDEDPGVPMVRTHAATGESTICLDFSGDGQAEGDCGPDKGQIGFTQQAIVEKKHSDKQKMTDFFSNDCGGRLVDVKVKCCLFVCHLFTVKAGRY